MLEKTQAFGKGFKGFSKPYIDVSVVFNALTGNETIVKNLRAYKHLSRSNAPEPKGSDSLPGSMEGSGKSGEKW